MRILVATSTLLFCTMAIAAPPSEQPAVDTGKAKASPSIGTTVVGEQESAIGLYITPWKEEPADLLDRPPLILDEPLVAIDTKRYKRLAQYQDAGVAYRRERLQRFK